VRCFRLFAYERLEYGIERIGLRIAGRIRRKRSGGNGFRVAILL